MKLVAVLAVVVIATIALPARAMCGCMLAPKRTVPVDPGASKAAVPELISDNTRVAIVRDGDRTVMTIANDVRETAIKEFALLVPVPSVPAKGDVRVADPALFQDLDAATRARFLDVVDPELCPVSSAFEPIRETLKPMSAGKSAQSASLHPADYGVAVEAHFHVGEYTIAILSAKESTGLIDWLRIFHYDVPKAAADVIDGYLKQKMFFFVARVAVGEMSGRKLLRPLQVEYHTPKLTLPIRLGMVNADGPQELLVFALSRRGRIEPTNYRTTRIASDVELPGVLREHAFDVVRSAFMHATEAEKQRVVFVEAQGIARQLDNPGAPDLALDRYGAPWSVVDGTTGQVKEPTFVTRLHFRYDRETFPEDLVLQETDDRADFRQTFTFHHEATALSCPEALPYIEELRARHQRQIASVVALTGEDEDLVRSHLQNLPPPPPPPPSPAQTTDAGVADAARGPSCAAAGPLTTSLTPTALVLAWSGRRRRRHSHRERRARGRAVAFAVAVGASLAAWATPAAADATLLLRTHAACRDVAPEPRFGVVAVDGGAHFTAALHTDSTCAAVAGAVSADGDAVTVRLDPRFDGAVPGACEVVCPGVIVVDGFIGGAPHLDRVEVDVPGKKLSAKLQRGKFVAQTATLTLTSTPSDAAVFRGRNVAIGRTPLTLVDEPAGAGEYWIVKGDLAKQLSIALSPGEHKHVGAKLIRDDDDPLDRIVAPVSLPRASPSDVTGVGAALRAAQPAIQSCIARAPAGVPRGKQILVLKLDVFGHVVDAGFREDAATKSVAGRCIATLARSWRLHPPLDQGARVIEVPLTLMLE